MQVWIGSGGLEVELIDIKNRRAFLRKSRVDGLVVEALRVGGKATVFGRLLDIVEYGDAYTKARLEQRQQRTVAIVRPEAITSLGEVMQLLVTNAFTISKLGIFDLSDAHCRALQQRLSEAGEEAPALTAGTVACIELLGANAVDALMALLGPDDPAVAKAELPSSIRARFGRDAQENGCIGSTSEGAARQEADFFFGSQPPPRCARRPGSTLGVVKPHAIAGGQVGTIVAAISKRFAVVNARMLTFTKDQAAEFLEVYRGVLPAIESSNLISELSSGPCLALEVSSGSDQQSSVEEFRSLCGPADPEVARTLRPESIRALVGVDKQKNGIHCTDLEDDGELELEYVFDLIV